jgi:hypothetical protein
MAQLGYCPDKTTMTELAAGLEVRGQGREERIELSMSQ